MLKFLDQMFTDDHIVEWNMSEDECIKKIDSIVYFDDHSIWKTNRSFKYISEPLNGFRTHDGYEIMTRETYRSSMKAILDLSIVPKESTCVLNLKFRVHKYSITFLNVFISFVLLMIGVAIVGSVINAGLYGLLVIMPFLPFLAMASIIIFVFKFLYDKEVKKMITLLSE